MYPLVGLLMQYDMIRGYSRCPPQVTSLEGWPNSRGGVVEALV